MNKQEILITALKEFYIKNRILDKQDDLQIKKLKDQLDEYAQKNPMDTEFLLYYALAAYVSSIGQMEDAITFLKRIISIDANNFYAIIFCAYLEDTWYGGIHEETFALLNNLTNKENRAHQSILELLKSWYFANKDDFKKEQSLLKAISLDTDYPQHYIELGMQLVTQNKTNEGLELIKVGLSKIKKIINNNDSPLKKLDMESFIDVFIKGFVTQRSIYDHLNAQINFNR